MAAHQAEAKEASPLLHDPEEATTASQDESSARLRVPHKLTIFASVFAAVAMAAVVGTAAVHRLSSRTASTGEDGNGADFRASSLPVYTPDYTDGNSLIMMKRTHLSLNAIKEGLWLETKIGLGQGQTEYFFNSSGGNHLHEGHGNATYPHHENEAMASEYHYSKDICSARSEFDWYDQNGSHVYNWHEFEGSQTGSGPLGPDYWWDKIYQLNTKRANMTMANWNVFLHKGQHMYVEDLTMHYKVHKEEGLPYIARKYISIAEGDEGRTMYVMFIPNMYNGNVIILHSASIGTAIGEKFSHLEDAACLYAVALPYTYDTLQHWYRGVYVTPVDPNKLQRPIPIMDTQPTSDMHKVVKYFKEELKIQDWAEVQLDLYSSETDEATGQAATCEVFSLSMASAMSTDYQARFVYTPEAGNFDEMEKLHKYMDETVREMVGFNSGYSRWMDEHWALSLPWQPNGVGNATQYLDDLRPYFEASNTPYHAHFTEVTNGLDTGSLWAWGVSGIAIEWHGVFSYETFAKVGNFDFCTSDTVCQASDRRCNLNQTDGLDGASAVWGGGVVEIDVDDSHDDWVSGKKKKKKHKKTERETRDGFVEEEEEE